jgi:DNA-binding MarR family transcriptional regulator
MGKISNKTVILADSLHSAAIHLLRLVRAQDRTTGIGPAQLSALSVLVFGGRMSLRRLAAIEQVRPPTMVRIVQGLVERQLAVSSADPSDARKISISATHRGRTLMLRARTRRVQALAAILAQRPESELRQLQTSVEVLKSLMLCQQPGKEENTKRPRHPPLRRRGPAPRIRH